ncbi:MAG: helix-turn-helix transcriptional regulator [Chloroflexota bacterium]|nr:helix-turn-helix transcriptional regulator [Chloroflexota bacterium]
MSSESNTPRLGAALRARRRQQRLSLRDLAAETGVSVNTLSRVERGHVPDLKNFHRIVDWLDIPADSLLIAEARPTPTPQIIARHLRSDRTLSDEAASKIARMVEEMYRRLATEDRRLAVHLRSARTFTPAAGELLAEILAEMHDELDESLAAES